MPAESQESNTNLVRYEQARNALADCAKVDEAKDIRDKAEALRVYARQRNDIEMERWAADIKIRAERRIGQISNLLERKPAGKLKRDLVAPGATKSRQNNEGKIETLKRAGITQRSANRAEQIAKIPEEEFESFLADKKAQREPVLAKDVLAKVASIVKKKGQSKARKAAVAESKIASEVRHGDFRKVLSDVPDNSVDLIFTDPPYARTALELYQGLAEFAERVLVKGGSIVTYFGQALLPEVIAHLQNAGLTYRWLICVRHEYGPARMAMPKVAVHQKPLLWFSKGIPFQSDFVADLINSKKPDKIDHDWQQSTEEAEYLISRLSPEGGMVIDPFAGSGTTLVVAKKLGRAYLGAEIDETHCRAASKRLTTQEGKPCKSKTNR